MVYSQIISKLSIIICNINSASTIFLPAIIANLILNFIVINHKLLNTQVSLRVRLDSKRIEHVEILNQEDEYDHLEDQMEH